MPRPLETRPVKRASEPALSPLAGKPAPKEMLINVAHLEKEYYERKPDINDRNQLVAFGTSGHRGSSLHGTFNEAHILATTQAICDYRAAHGIVVVKYWLHVTQAEQLRRFKERQRLSYKRWKLTADDLRNRRHRAAYQFPPSHK